MQSAPGGKVLKSDISLAKIYLKQEHIGQRNRIVSVYLDLAENRAQRGILAEVEYDGFRMRQDREFESDFDRQVKRLKGKEQ